MRVRISADCWGTSYMWLVSVLGLVLLVYNRLYLNYWAVIALSYEHDRVVVRVSA